MRAWILCVAAAACIPDPRHRCATGTECPGGLCIEGGCAHADPSCPSGAAYEPELGGTCTPVTELVDAAVDAIDAATVVRCNAGALETCVGDVCTPMACPLGCFDDPTPHCGVFAPANLPASFDYSGAIAELTLTPGTIRIDSDSGAITQETSPSGPLTILRDGGPGVIAGIRYEPVGMTMAALVMGSLEVEAGATVYVHGDRALIVVAQSDLTLTGTIDIQHCAPPADTDRTCAGPGGGAGGAAGADGEGCASGGHAPTVTSGTSGGGAGGGNVVVGAPGGAGSVTPGGAAAPAGCGLTNGIPLVGGSGGGGSRGAAGGAGGGAIQLAAFKRLVLAGRIQAGGRGGGAPTGAEGGGGGGGAGGLVLLQAPTVDLSGAGVAAGGGGGGCGNCTAAGADGVLGSGNAAGGAVGGAIPGGRGGAAASQALAGGAGTTTAGGGGGGGAWGVIRIDSFGSALGTPAFLSPSASNRGQITVR